MLDYEEALTRKNTITGRSDVRFVLYAILVLLHAIQNDLELTRGINVPFVLGQWLLQLLCPFHLDWGQNKAIGRCTC